MYVGYYIRRCCKGEWSAGCLSSFRRQESQDTLEVRSRCPKFWCWIRNWCSHPCKWRSMEGNLSLPYSFPTVIHPCYMSLSLLSIPLVSDQMTCSQQFSFKHVCLFPIFSGLFRSCLIKRQLILPERQKTRIRQPNN